MLLYDLLNLFSGLVAIFSFLILVGYIFSFVKQVFKKENPSLSGWLNQMSRDTKEFRGNALLVVLVIALFGRLVAAPSVHQLIGVHDLTLKPDGTYCFYVEATPRGGKTYTLPAEVRKSSGDYSIERVFFANGGYLSVYEFAEIEERIGHYSKDDVDWDLVLLNEHAYSPMVIETDNATGKDVSLLVLEILPIAVFIFLFARKETNKEETAQLMPVMKTTGEESYEKKQMLRNDIAKMKKALHEHDQAYAQNKPIYDEAFSDEELKQMAASGEFPEDKVAEYVQQRESLAAYMRNAPYIRKTIVESIGKLTKELAELECQE